MRARLANPMKLGEPRFVPVTCTYLNLSEAHNLLKLLDKKSYKICGGEGGIRTPDTVARMPHFECGAFNHSATSPRLFKNRTRMSEQAFCSIGKIKNVS